MQQKDMEMSQQIYLITYPWSVLAEWNTLYEWQKYDIQTIVIDNDKITRNLISRLPKILKVIKIYDDN